VSSLQVVLDALSTVGRLAAIVALFLLLVAPHEGGHFLVAKLFRVQVYEYSLGMGTKLWSTVRAGTTYAIRAFPLGGYVRLAGMELDDRDNPDGFHTKPAHQRLLILLAGPAVNFLVATAIMVGVYLTQVNEDPGKVMGIVQNSPAYAQGIRPGDSIRSVDGRLLRHGEDLNNIEQATGEKPLALGVHRENGSTFTATVSPQLDKTDKKYRIGVRIAGIVTPQTAIGSGLTWPFVTAGAFGQGIYELATGQVPGGLFGPNGLSGPIGFGYITYHAAAEGLISYLVIVAVLSMALGLTNLLPLPVLDGGRIMVVILEKLRGRPFDREREMAVQRYGLVALFALMALIAFFDVQRIATGQFPGPR
jgi:regulator of sigma E protease